MSLGNTLLANFVAIALVFVVIWATSLVLRDASIIDRYWGAGFVLIAWFSVLATAPPHGRATLIAALVTIWGLRLSVYLTWRNWGQGEDRRYLEMRNNNGGKFAIASLIKVFFLQAVLLWIIALPMQVGIYAASSWPLIAYVGVTLWVVGFAFEAIGDWQLARFKANPSNKGQVMKRGLWRYSRHPNYFGEFLLWWGLYLVAFDAQSWWWTIIGPALLSFLLLRVSGVTLLENSIRNRVDGYEDYVRATSSFVPWPPSDKQQSKASVV